MDGRTDGGTVAAVNGQGAAVVAMKVESALAVIATYVGIGDLPKAIRETLMTLKRKAQAPVVAVLMILAKPIRAAFDALLKGLGLGDREPVVDPLDFGKDKKKRLYVTGDGKVWMRASSETDVIDWLDKNAKGTGTDSAKAKDALVVARKLGEDGKKVKAESSKTQKKGTVKGVGVAVQTALADEKKLAALLDGLGGGCSVPGKGQCLRAGRAIWRGDGTGSSSAVESVRLGERVATWLPAFEIIYCNLY